MENSSVKLSINLGEARYLSQDEQEKYEKACENYGKKAGDNLRIGLNGSNLFKVLLLNQIGIRTASLFELDLTARTKPSFLEGHYEDAPAVALRSSRGYHPKNNSLIKNLVKIIGKTEFSHTMIIEGLGLENDEDSDYGLNLNEGRRFKVIEAPDFDYKNNGRRFARINPDYTIEFDAQGERTLYARENGLSGVCLLLGLNSNGELLANSDGGGRVVVLSGEATSQKPLEDYVSQIGKARKEYFTELRKIREQIDEELKLSKYFRISDTYKEEL